WHVRRQIGVWLHDVVVVGQVAVNQVGGHLSYVQAAFEGNKRVGLLGEAHDQRLARLRVRRGHQSASHQRQGRAKRREASHIDRFLLLPQTQRTTYSAGQTESRWHIRKSRRL